jgi:hypothetical protein
MAPSTPVIWRSAPRGQGQHHLQDSVQRRRRHDGGQPVDGTTSVPMIAQQMAAEGVKRSHW